MLALASAFVTLVFAAPALAAVGDPSVAACLNAGTAQGPCSEQDGLTAGRPEALSPDGKELYVATSGGTPPGGSTTVPPSVLIFDRGAYGALTYRSSVTQPNLNNPQDIVVSPDGTSVYVSNAGSAISEFARSADGSLAANTQAISSGSGWGAPHGMAISSDSRYLYVSTIAGTLLVFARDTVTGNLTQLTSPNGCYSEVATSGCTQVKGIPNQSWEIALSPDGKNLYVAGHEDAYYYYGPESYCSLQFNGTCYQYTYTAHYVPASGGLALFSVHADGALSQPATACVTNNGADGGNPGGSPFAPGGGPAATDCQNANDPALVGAHVVTVSPDGKSVYVGTDNTVVSYARAADGSLTRSGCMENASGAAIVGCTDAHALASVYWLRVSPDGKSVIANSRDSNGVAFFDRSQGDGTLAQRAGTAGCITSDGTSGACQTLAALGSYGSVAVSSDSLDVYVTGQTSGALATIHVDAAPVCSDATATVTENQPAPVSLSCVDPNGDQLDSVQAVRAPFDGSLGAFDVAGSRVTYSPFSNYLGADSFTFSATARGVTSAPATASLNVVAPPPAPVAPPNPTPAPTPTPTPAAASAAAGRPVANANGVTFTISCAAGPACAGGAVLTTTEHMAGKKISAVSSKSKLKRVTVGRASFRAAGGSRVKVVVKLSKAGKKLLARFKKLPVTLRVTMSSGRKTVTLAAKKLVLKLPKKKAKHA